MSSEQRPWWKRFTSSVGSASSSPTVPVADRKIELSDEELVRREDLQITSTWLFIALLAGLAAVFLRYLIPFMYRRPGENWNFTGQLATSFLWASAWFAAAFVIGFLFGIPKSANKNTPNTDQGSKGAQNADDGQQNAPAKPYQLRVNTNLEEVSDWLTKILLGATLTQLIKIPSYLVRAAVYMSKNCSVGCSDNEEVFAGGIIFFFSTLGFFAGYILTRMYFARAFARSDSETSTIRELNKLASSRTPTGEYPEAEYALKQLAENSKNIPLAGISAMAASAVAKGALVLGDIERAMQAATIALSQNPNDPRARLDYAVAFDRMGGSSEAVLAAIDNVRNAIQPDLDLATKADLYNSMVYLSLYQDPPEGFQKAIRLANEYLTFGASRSSASIYINLACAYAQLYSYLKAENTPTDSTVPKTPDEARDKAIWAIQEAVNRDQGSRMRFRELTDGSAEDNDLAVLYANEPKVKELLG